LLPDTAPTTTEPSTTTSTIPEFVPAPIAWRPCEDGLECAEVTVPVDYGQPAGPTLAVSVQGAPASGRRTPAELASPGGRGGGTADCVANRKENIPGTVTEQFDVVGVDCRRTAACDFASCVTIPELYAADHTIEDEADTAALVDV